MLIDITEKEWRELVRHLIGMPINTHITDSALEKLPREAHVILIQELNKHLTSQTNDHQERHV